MRIVGWLALWAACLLAPALAQSPFVGNQGASGVATPGVQIAQYVSGNCYGGIFGISLVTKNGPNSTVTNQAFTLNALKVSSVGGQSAVQMIAYVFDSQPTNSTCLDRSTFTLSSLDIPKLLAAPFPLTQGLQTGTSSTFAEQINMTRESYNHGVVVGPGSPIVWVALVSASTFTPASTTDLIVTAQADLSPP